jgi:hypothetical protein
VTARRPEPRDFALQICKIVCDDELLPIQACSGKCLQVMITARKFAVFPLGYDEAFVALAASSAPHFMAQFAS